MRENRSPDCSASTSESWSSPPAEPKQTIWPWSVDRKPLPPPIRGRTGSRPLWCARPWSTTRCCSPVGRWPNAPGPTAGDPDRQGRDHRPGGAGRGVHAWRRPGLGDDREQRNRHPTADRGGGVGRACRVPVCRAPHRRGASGAVDRYEGVPRPPTWWRSALTSSGDRRESGPWSSVTASPSDRSSRGAARSASAGAAPTTWLASWPRRRRWRRRTESSRAGGTGDRHA